MFVRRNAAPGRGGQWSVVRYGQTSATATWKSILADSDAAAYKHQEASLPRDDKFDRDNKFAWADQRETRFRRSSGLWGVRSPWLWAAFDQVHGFEDSLDDRIHFLQPY